MKKLLTFMVIGGMVGILFGCVIFGNDAEGISTTTPFLVLPMDAEGKLITDASLRTGPGAHFDELVRLPKGTQIHVLGVSPDIKWYLTTYNNGQGQSLQAWVSADLVDLNLETVDRLTSTFFDTNTPNPAISATSTLFPTNTLPSTSSPVSPSPAVDSGLTSLPVPSFTFTSTQPPPVFPPATKTTKPVPSPTLKAIPPVPPTPTFGPSPKPPKPTFTRTPKK